MKRVLILLLFISASFFVLSTQNSQAQCKGFAKNVCKLELVPFTHDGNYHAAVLTEGEEAELYKTFYSDQEYRVAVCGSDNLPEIEFKVMDAGQKVLYSNKDHDFSKTWDFKLESSQQLKVVVKVPSRGDKSQEPASGCVAIMFGFKVK
ncbi:MAG: hypothetical protein J7K46_06600 [Bacteroidales bacterium]|nr:hypothetical protein [Bacteroidales bacterium]